MVDAHYPESDRKIVHRPQCTLYAQGMSFGGDLGLVVASSLGKARAVLVCTVPLQGLCATCVQPVHTLSSGGPLTPDRLGTKLLLALPLVGSSLEFLM